MRSFLSIYSGSDSSVFAKLTVGLLVVSTSRSIYWSKSEPPYKDSSSSASGWLSPVSLTTFLFILKFVTRFLLLFLVSVASSWQSWLLLLLPSSSKLALALEVLLELTLIVAAYVVFVLFGLMLNVATPVLFLALLYAARLSLKVSNFFPISLLILFMFLAWFFVRTSANLPMMSTCFIVNFWGCLKNMHLLYFHQTH